MMYKWQPQLFMKVLPSSKISLFFSQKFKVGLIDQCSTKLPFFEPCPHFVPLMQELISKRAYMDPTFTMESPLYRNSFMPIYDFRDVPDRGRSPDIRNVFGHVLVDGEGKMVQGSYEPNEWYAPFNERDGFVILSDYLLECVRLD